MSGRIDAGFLARIIEEDAIKEGNTLLTRFFSDEFDAESGQALIDICIEFANIMALDPEYAVTRSRVFEMKEDGHAFMNAWAATIANRATEWLVAHNSDYTDTLHELPHPSES